ncbi:Methylitaconate delta2-delta3-isomerase [Lasiodiplodia theobromae]|uniref:Methylitaconate delta2-delta3-isomerase n=1 Tax=Lasiodiplodia theobromae TaxID=45133 RepID=UPI0015C2DE4E|nr:Methylitaconate delta2-delta3-isomerase [Lasiodiplodia theobromae]KAF4537729.1 Methylitaconate delta2-delta3-isomerase [Lasiodiplodia theobromae]
MEDWTVPLLAAMGSAAGDPRQIDGIGGATSTTSKVAVVAKSTVPGIDVEYTFGQVGVGKTTVDFSGNCGNMAAGVGPFALDEGMVRVERGKKKVDIRILNTNTSRILVTTVDVDELGQYKEDGDFKMDGVKGTGSMVRVAFLKPSGSMTGSFLPTGNPTDVIHLEGQDLSVMASLVDAANPFIFIDASTLPQKFMSQDPHSVEFLRVIENIRRVGAVMMGLSADTKAAAVTQGTPKVAIVSAVPLWNSRDESTTADLHVAAFSMGKLHPSLQLTGAVCLGAAAVTSGTVPNRVMSAAALPTPERTPSPGPHISNDMPKVEKKTVRIGHARGLLAVEVEHVSGARGTEIKSAVVLRTARRLFEGNVLFYS